jgi:hypothetical protein
MGKRVWITAALTAVAVASGIGVAAHGAPKAANGGFPTGHFKIKNGKTGECIQAFFGHESDTFGDGSSNPEAGRIIQAAGPRPCENTKNQVWKYDAAHKHLESLGVDGHRCLALNRYFGLFSLENLLLSRSPQNLNTDEKDLVTPVEPGTAQAASKTPRWNLSLGSCNEAPSGSIRTFPFQTDKGMIWSAFTGGPLPTDDSYLTADADGSITGMTKGRPGQQWTFPVAP